MKIAIVCNDNGVSNTDFSNPGGGNAGIGGMGYGNISLATYYNRAYPGEVIFYYYNATNSYSEDLECVLVKDDEELLEKIEEHHIDIYFNGQQQKSEDWYQRLSALGVKVIYDAGCFLSADNLKEYKAYDCIRRIVFKTQVEYDVYLDDDIIKKAEKIGYIVGLDVPERERIQGNNVVFVGNLTPLKGFHILAAQWKKVLDKVPDAQLYVIGAGNLYDRKIRLGKYGTADEKYEQQFMKYLCDVKGKILPSVHFLGNLGIEKSEILKKMKVGVVNPSALTETFCISAVELQAHGVPIVTIKKNSFLEVIQDKKTGLLYRNSKNIYKGLIKLLTEESINEQYSRNAVKFVKRYSYTELIPQYRRMFCDVMEEIPPGEIYDRKNCMYNFKLIRICNRFLRRTLRLNIIPSFEEMFYILVRVKKHLEGKFYD